MKILHICLSCFYIDNAGYQENYLVRQNVADGHDVLVIASTETQDGRGGLTYGETGEYQGSDGARVIRIPYTRWLPNKLARKLRIHSGVYDLVARFAPDTILFHGCAGNEVVTAARYALDNPDVPFFVDSHEDFNNSARTFVSHHILHRLFYRNRLQKAIPAVEKILCLSTESIDFVSDVYAVNREKLEFFPLGGDVLSREELQTYRAQTRDALDLQADNFVFLQSGKMTKRKKLEQSLRAFAKLPDENLRFLIAGLLTEEVQSEVQSLISADERVQYLGWKSPEELNRILCAVDVYLQPGTQSVTMQNALCCGCPVIIDDVPAHQAYLSAGVTLVNGPAELGRAMKAATEWNVDAKRSQAWDFAQANLNYRMLANRILQR